MNRLECYQAAAVALDSWACNGTMGRAKTAPEYQQVVEGRDVPSSYAMYSSCADRAHWRLWRLGCRLPFVNREERTPFPKDFHWGVNIAWLHDTQKGSPARMPGADWEPSPGDEMLIWNTGPDAHSLSIISYDGSRAVTANYGTAGMSKAAFPGGKFGNAPLVFHGGHWWYGEGQHAKQVQRVLRLVDIIETLTAKASFDGIPFDANFTGEVADSITGEHA